MDDDTTKDNTEAQTVRSGAAESSAAPKIVRLGDDYWHVILLDGHWVHVPVVPSGDGYRTCGTVPTYFDASGLSMPRPS